MFYDASIRSPLPFDPLKALVAPRPIGWISSIAANGDVNLAPYSFFQVIAQRPGMVIFTSEGAKDSVAFSAETGEFVCNIVTYEFKDQMWLSSEELPRGHNEFAHAGLEMEPSQMVKPPRVKGIAAALECKVLKTFELIDLDGVGTGRIAVTGQIVGVYIADKFIKEGLVDTPAMKLIARCGYYDYAMVDDVFKMGDHKKRTAAPLVKT
jgi:flavin reductase (DIM6/NTAB) family NADH-FMN oxidoreductase RutF